MSDISPVNHNNHAALNRMVGQRQTEPTPRMSQGPARGDQVEVSQTAHLLAKMAELPDVRQDLVNQVRAQIDAGTYETPEKIQAAVEALAEDL